MLSLSDPCSEVEKKIFKDIPTKHETFLKRFEKVSKRFLVKKRCINVFKMFSQ